MTIRPDLEEFRRLAQGATVVPVAREILADALTPVLAWSTLGGGPGSFLLESVEHGEKWGRYSFVGSRPACVVRGRRGRLEIERDGRVETRDCDDPWPGLRAVLSTWTPPPAGLDFLPRFWGGAVGYVAYDAVRTFEPSIGDRLADPDAWDFSFAIGGAMLIFDDLRQRVFAVSARRIEVDTPADIEAAYEAAVAELQDMADELSRPRIPRLLAPPTPPARDEGAPLPPSSFDEPTYQTAVRTAQEHIRAGDIFQVVPSQRFRVDAKGVDLFDVYLAQHCVQSSPSGATPRKNMAPGTFSRM